jgi:hypothetical protein
MTSDVIEFAGAARTLRGRGNNVIASEAKQSRFRHSGAMQSIEPGISRFRVWCWRTIPE